MSAPAFLYVSPPMTLASVYSGYSLYQCDLSISPVLCPLSLRPKPRHLCIYHPVNIFHLQHHHHFAPAANPPPPPPAIPLSALQRHLASVYSGYGLYHCDLNISPILGPLKISRPKHRFCIYPVRPVSVLQRQNQLTVTSQAIQLNSSQAVSHQLHHSQTMVPPHSFNAIKVGHCTNSTIYVNNGAASRSSNDGYANESNIHNSHYSSNNSSAISPAFRAKEDFCDRLKPTRLNILLNQPPPDNETRHKHAWNPADRSLNIFVKENDPFTCHRHPVAQSSDCIRGAFGYSRGLHVWQIRWPLNQRGTHAVVGVATRNANLHCNGYQSLVGMDAESWGWELGRNKLYHNRVAAGQVPSPFYPTPNGNERFPVPEEFEVVLDCDQGILAFHVDGQYLGVAFRGLKNKTLYPIISCVWGHAEISIKYLGGLDPEPLPLMDICRQVIRRQIGPSRIERGQTDLMLPKTLKNYLFKAHCNN